VTLLFQIFPDYQEYKENEDNNAHSENALLLAHHFGTDAEKKEAKERKNDE
jgi:hypothetical protein